MLALATTDYVSTHKGTLPVVLAAGHGGRAVPAGVAERFGVWPGFVTKRDEWTAEIAMGVAEGLLALLGEAPSVVVARFGRKYIDANRVPQLAYEAPRMRAWQIYRAYHSAIRKVCKTAKTGLLLDIHGTSINTADLYIGTIYGQSVGSQWIETSLAKLLANVGYRVVFDHPRLTGGLTVAWHGAWAGGLDAIQLEIAKPLRTTQVARTTLIKRLVSVLAVVVNDYK
jgi:N-formylglutamate amidohydrolase